MENILSSFEKEYNELFDSLLTNDNFLPGSVFNTIKANVKLKGDQVASIVMPKHSIARIVLKGVWRTFNFFGTI